MNTKTFLNAIKLAQKPAAIGFIFILGLGVFTAFAIAVSTLLAILIPVLVFSTKVAIFTYPLFISGLIAIKSKEPDQKKETFIPLLTPSEVRVPETILNDVIVTLPPVDIFFDLYQKKNQPSWQQQILSEIQLDMEKQPTAETQDLQPTEDLSTPNLDTGIGRETPYNQLTITRICWQALSLTASLLESIRASELKSIASELQVPKYRNMNKTQLLLEILRAYDETPVFSE